MADRLFGVLQRLGRSFMLPIALLPIAGILLGIGTTFTNEITLSFYHLDYIMGPGTVPYIFFAVLKNVGQVIFSNLAVIFAIGVAIGMAKHEKEVAALSAFIAYMVMNITINVLLTVDGQILSDGTVSGDVIPGSIDTACGILSLQTGVFGGIIVGLGVAFLHNRFYTIQFHQVFSFFSGTRFIPIISTFTYMAVGVILFFVWPYAQKGIVSCGDFVTGTGYLGTLFFGVMKRALIPLGLHHVFYMPFWQTAVGGTMEIGGIVYEGGQNIFFAQLADPSTVRFSGDACRFFSGEVIFMIFGLPGAALAMYHCARPERRKQAGSLLLSAAVTSMLTGITEPLEFTFIFVSPILYIIQVILAGSCYMVAQIFHITIGLTFSGGLFDFLTFGVLQGNDKTNWILVIPIGIIYFFLYYLSFKFFILKLDLKTPGRENDFEQTSLHLKKDYENRQNGSDIDARMIKWIIEGLGGKKNIEYLDCCATRLRCTLNDASLIDRESLNKSGHSGLILRKKNVQLIYGPQVAVIKSKLEAALEESDVIDFWQEIKSPVCGEVIRLCEVKDLVFSSEVLGKGFAINPKEDKIYSPVDGEVVSVFDTKHAIFIRGDQGAEIMIHVGIDTVKLKGNYIKDMVNNGDRVKAGDLLAVFNRERILEEGFSVVTPVVITNSDDYKEVSEPLRKRASVGDIVIKLR